jgi:hypothetical protein
MSGSRNKKTGFQSYNEELEELFSSSLAETIDNLTEEEKKKLKKFKAKDFKDLVEKFVDAISDGYIQAVTKDKGFHRLRDRIYGVGFRRRLRKRWSGYINQYEILTQTCIEAVTRLRAEVGNSKRNTPHLGVMIRLHARCLRINGEILTLSLNGYGNAALARWRSLHEATVVLAAISKLGEDASEAFIAYSAVESYKAMKIFNTHAPKLGEKRFTRKQLGKALKAKNDAVRKYGPQIKQEYGWANLYSKKKINTFKDLEKYFGPEHLRPYYKWSSYSVHTNIKTISTGEEADAISKSGIVLIGPSDRGFEDALQLSALTIAHATVVMLTSNPNLENLSMARTIMKYERITSDTFGVFFKKNKTR